MSLLSDLRLLDFWRCDWLMDDEHQHRQRALPAPDGGPCALCGPEKPHPHAELPSLRLPNVNFPENFGLKAWDFDPLHAVQPGNAMALSALHFARLSINAPTCAKALHLAVASPSGALAANACFAGIYDATGALVAQTGDISGAFTLAQILSLPLTREAQLAPGTYFMALLLNGAEPPRTWSAPLGLSSVPQASGEAAEFFSIPGPLDALPAHADFGSIQLSTAAYWAAIS